MDIERRREQNRTAQRRFRRRQKSAAIAEQAQVRIGTDPSLVPGSTPGSKSPLQQNTESYGSQDLISPEITKSSVPSVHIPGTPSISTPVDTPRRCGYLKFYGTNLLLDNIELVNMEGHGIVNAETHSINSVQRQQLDDMVEISAYADNPSLGRRVLHSKEKKPKKNTDTLQQHHLDGSNTKISNHEEGTTAEPGTKSWLTPLHVAAQQGRNNIVRTLLQHNADCNAKDSANLTPLAHATIGGHKEVVALLLQHGAQISEVDNQCRTALHWAVMRQREGVLKLLLETCGREHPVIDKYDRTGRAPVHIATETNFEEGLRLLLQYGANVHLRLRKDALGV